MPDISYSFYRSAEPAYEIERNLPVDIIGTGHEVRTSRSYRWDNARHLFARNHTFQFTLSGLGYFEYASEGRRIRERVGPGKMFIASWDQAFEYYYDGGAPWDFMWIALTGNFADQVVQALRRPLPIVGLPTDSSPVSFLKSLQERLAGSYRIDHYELTGLGYEFLLQMLKEKTRTEGRPEDRFLMEARDFVTRDLRNACVASLAGRFGYAEKYFNEYFKRRAGTTPNRFIVEQRIRYASSLLVNTRKKISAVASESGFAEENYFSKVFKKYRGVPPAEYREINKDRVPVSEVIIL